MVEDKITNVGTILGVDDLLVLFYSNDASIEDSDVEELYEFLLKNYPEKLERLGLFLHSHGGDAGAAYKMLQAIREYCNSLNAIIPSYAKSAATLIALGCDKIIMTPISELGPVDPMVTHHIDRSLWVSAKAVLTAAFEVIPEMVERGKGVEVAILPLDPAHLGFCKQSLRDSETYCRLILESYQLKNNKSKIDEVASEFIERYPSHDFPLMYSRLKELGLNVELLDNRDALLKVWDLFSELKNLVKSKEGERTRILLIASSKGIKFVDKG